MKIKTKFKAPYNQGLLKKPVIYWATFPKKPSEPVKKLAIIEGKVKIDKAKIIGITPAGLTLNGK